MMLIASSVVYIGMNGALARMESHVDIVEYAAYANDAILESTIAEVHCSNATSEIILKDRTVAFVITFRLMGAQLSNLSNLDEAIRMKYALGIKDEYKWAARASLSGSEMFISDDVHALSALPKGCEFASDALIVDGARAEVTLYVWR